MRYFITTKATEDKPQTTIEYTKREWIETIEMLKQAGRSFHAYKVENN